MPELPDIVVYLDALRPRILGRTLDAVRVASPFLVRSVEPPIAAAAGRRVTELRRLGKRIVIGLADPLPSPHPLSPSPLRGEGEPRRASELFLVLHLMIAGRLRWRPRGAAIPGRVG